jgi:hypothetical protein
VARRRWLQILVGLLLVAIAAAAVTPIRRAALGGIGRHLTASDAPADADLLAMVVESGFAGAIKVGDLYHQHPAPTVALFTLRPDPLGETLRSRHVVLPEVMVDVLQQLGIPKHAIVQMPVSELGTTETSAALAAWSRANPSARVVVVIEPSHGRRYQRALLRAWPAGHPMPRVVTTQYSLFRADDWWQSRTTLREGLFETEKLGLDYLLHPW